MSQVKVSGNASGTGVFTVAAPNSNSNYTLTLPTATTTLVGTDATQTLTNKTLTTPNFDSAQVATVSGTAPLYMCRAWVNFNGTGTVAIRASGNVSSITDNGTGDYTVNFTTALPDDTGSAVVQSKTMNAGSVVASAYLGYYNNTTNPLTTTSLRIICQGSGGGVFDIPFISAAVFR